MDSRNYLLPENDSLRETPRHNADWSLGETKDSSKGTQLILLKLVTFLAGNPPVRSFFFLSASKKTQREMQAAEGKG